MLCAALACALPVGRFLVGQRHGAAAIQLAPRFAFHQHPDTVRQTVDSVLLPRHNIREIIDRAIQMGNLFFKVGLMGHGFLYGFAAGFAKPRFQSSGWPRSVPVGFLAAFVGRAVARGGRAR